MALAVPVPSGGEDGNAPIRPKFATVHHRRPALGFGSGVVRDRETAGRQLAFSTDVLVAPRSRSPSKSQISGSSTPPRSPDPYGQNSTAAIVAAAVASFSAGGNGTHGNGSGTLGGSGISGGGIGGMSIIEPPTGRRVTASRTDAPRPPFRVMHIIGGSSAGAGGGHGTSGGSHGGVSLEDATRVFRRHPFFNGLREVVVESYAKGSSRREYQTVRPSARKSETGAISTYPGAGFSTAGMVLITEGTLDVRGDDDCLWVIERGRVQIEESGEVLGTLDGGSVFGDAVAFGCMKVQPVTVRLLEGILHVWCVPNILVRNVMRATPALQQILQVHMGRQWKSLLWGRALKLSFLNHCGATLLQKVQRKMKVEYRVRGEALCSAEEPTKCAHFVMTGSVTVEKVVSERRMSVDKMRPRRVSEQVSNRRSTLLKMQKVSFKAPAEDPQKVPRVQVGPAGRQHAGQGRARKSVEVSVPDSIRQRALRGREVLALPVPDPANNEGFLTSMSPTPSTEDVGDADAQPENHAEEDAEEEHDDDEDLEEIRNSCNEESDSSSSASSSSSDDEDEEEDDEDEGNVSYRVPDCFAPLEPKEGSFIAVAGHRGALLFGDAVLLMRREAWPNTVTADRDCIVFTTTVEDFVWALGAHRSEMKRFDQIQEAGYLEWMKCGISQLGTVDIFRRCCPAFLEKLAASAEPKIFFDGQEVLQEGAQPDGLVLLMAGKVSIVQPDGTISTHSSSPHTFGSLHWLGAATDRCHMVTAKSLCQVLEVQKEHLLEALKLYPEESSNMISQVRRHNGRRITYDMNSPTSQKKGLYLSLWHVHFCKDCEPAFLDWFTRAMESLNLVPGMSVMSGGEEDPEFMLLLKDGTVEVTERGRVSQDPGVRKPQLVKSPLLICGFDTTRNIDIVASQICAVQRMSLRAATRLAERFPDEAARVFSRLMAFQARSAAEVKAPWWSASAALSRLPPFTDSAADFIAEAARLMVLEVYLPGETIVEEGTPVDCTLILECGRCNVEKRSSKNLYSVEVLNDIGDGHWIGGVAGVCGFAGETRRRATVRATTICKVHRIPTSDLVQVLSSNAVERQRFRTIAENELRAKDRDRLEDHDFFLNFSREFLNLLRPKCRVQVFFSGETLFAKGQLADSLLILGNESRIKVETFEGRFKEVTGPQCLGVSALISPRPTRRASTVITLMACAVRVLTRADWTDALKLYPKHREWIEKFTQDELKKIADAKESLMHRRAWEKIQARDLAAKSDHRERLARGFRCWPPSPRQTDRCLPGISCADVEAQAAPTEIGQMPERVPCFNGCEAVLPHTVLPRLGGLIDVPKGKPYHRGGTMASGEDGSHDGKSKLGLPTFVGVKRASMVTAFQAEDDDDEDYYALCATSLGLTSRRCWGSMGSARSSVGQGQ